jgi:hypothetical protein
VLRRYIILRTGLLRFAKLKPRAQYEIAITSAIAAHHLGEAKEVPLPRKGLLGPNGVYIGTDSPGAAAGKFPDSEKPDKLPY